MKKILLVLLLSMAFITNAFSQAVFVPDNAADITFDNDDYPTVDAALNALINAPGTTDSFDHTLSPLPLETTPSLDDLVMIVDDPGGTPVIKKITVAALLHAADELQITSFTNNKNDLENGTTVTSTIFNWTVSASITSESLDNSIGAISPASLRTYTHNSSYSTNRTYVLTISDGSQTDTASTTIRFLNSNYYGVSSSTTLNSAGVNALSRDLSTTRAQTRNGLTPSAQYIYIAYPASYGTATFTVNGLLNNDWTLSVQNHTNASGATVSYNVYRTNNLLTGTYNVVVN